MRPDLALATLDEAPMSATLYRIWFAGSGGPLLDGYSIFTIGVALSPVAVEMNLGPFAVGLIGSALVLGAALGAIVGGSGADRFGRKKAFIVDMIILAAGAILSAVAWDPAPLLAGQFLIGVGIGIDFPVSGSYVSELMPRRVRSRMVVATIALQSVGMLAGVAVALGCLGQSADLSVWRFIVGSTAVVAIFFLLLRLGIPESPRWLIEHGRAAEAAAIIARLVPQGMPIAGLDQKCAPLAAAGISAPAHGAKIGLQSLFSRKYRARTLLVSMPWFLLDIATYGVGMFTPVILGAMHFGARAKGPVATDFADALGSAAIDVFLLVGFLVGLWAVPRFGRIHMQVMGFMGMALGMLVLLSTSLAADGPAAHVPLVLTGFILFNLAMNAGPNATTFTLAPELFPTAMRASASGFAAAIAKVGATLGTFFLPQIRAELGVTAVLVLMSVVGLLGALKRRRRQSAPNFPRLTGTMRLA